MKVELQNEAIEPLKAALEEYCKNHDLHQCKNCKFLRIDGSCIQENIYGSIRGAGYCRIV